MNNIRRWEAYAAGLIVLVILAVVVLNRPAVPRGGDSSPSASSSQTGVSRPSEQATTAGSATVVASTEPSVSATVKPAVGPMPTAKPTATPTVKPTSTPMTTPTAAPTAPPTPAPTPAPSTGILPCIPEPGGYAVQAQPTVIVGQDETIDIQGQPTGQKVTMSVHYPDGSTVALGTHYASARDDGGWTHAIFTWTVPASMMPGSARASWTIPCEGTRNFDSYYDFTIAAS